MEKLTRRELYTLRGLLVVQIGAFIFSDMETVEANPELLRIEAEYRLSEYSFDQASEALTQFFRTHLGVTAPLIRRHGIILARLNELRDKNPQLRKLESEQRKTKMRRDTLLHERAELRTALGLCR